MFANYKYEYIAWMKKSVNPDQLASLEASCSGPTMFSKGGIELLKTNICIVSFFNQYTVTLCGKSYFHTVKNSFKGKNVLPLGWVKCYTSCYLALYCMLNVRSAITPANQTPS